MVRSKKCPQKFVSDVLQNVITESDVAWHNASKHSDFILKVCYRHVPIKLSFIKPIAIEIAVIENHNVIETFNLP